MKKRNLVAMGLAGIMAVGMCMPVMAATDITANSDGNPSSATGQTTLKYDEAVAYTVSIPAAATYDSDTKKSTMSIGIAAGYVLANNKSVKITADIGADGIKLDDGSGNKIVVELKKDGTALTNANNRVAEFKATSDNAANPVGAQELSVELGSGQVVKYAGTYEGSITFNVAYGDATV